MLIILVITRTVVLGVKFKYLQAHRMFFRIIFDPTYLGIQDDKYLEGLKLFRYAKTTFIELAYI